MTARDGRGTQPNVLWYCTDQQRYDTIGCLGNPEIHTPHIDSLCDRGIAFERAYCQAPICTPSRVSFLTGRYPASHNVHRNGNQYFPSNEKLVTRLIADNGYDCGLVGKLHIAGAQHTAEPRTDDGYRFYSWSHHPFPDITGNAYTEWLSVQKGINVIEEFGKISHPYGPGMPEDLHHTTWCTEMALEFIEQDHDGPWMLCVNTFSPHPPFLPPPNILSRYKPAEMSMPLFKESDLRRQRDFRHIDQQTLDAMNPYELAKMVRQGSHTGPVDMPLDKQASTPPSFYDPQMLKACYYAEIELIDKQFGRIVEMLSKRGELQNTIIVYMSDHGELLGDHGLAYKGCRFFESLVRVPVILSWKDHWLEGKRSHALIELVDIAPTLLDSLGIEVPVFMEGRSLLQSLQGRKDLNSHKDHVMSEYYDAMAAGSTAGEYAGSHGTMYFDGKYKLSIYHGTGQAELFDLENDPGEFVNLWSDPEQEELKCRLLRAHLEAFSSTTDPGPPRTKDY